MFNLIKENIVGKTVLDLYSGVGTLSIVASKVVDKVYSIEVTQNAVKNALINSAFSSPSFFIILLAPPSSIK